MIILDLVKISKDESKYVLYVWREWLIFFVLKKFGSLCKLKPKILPFLSLTNKEFKRIERFKITNSFSGFILIFWIIFGGTEFKSQTLIVLSYEQLNKKLLFSVSYNLIDLTSLLWPTKNPNLLCKISEFTYNRNFRKSCNHYTIIIPSTSIYFWRIFIYLKTKYS